MAIAVIISFYANGLPPGLISKTAGDSSLEVAITTINSLDINGSFLTADDATISLDENPLNGSSILTVSASDPENDPLTFEITGGNSSGAFTIDATTGVITVTDATQIDYEAVTNFILTVKVTDGVNEVDAAMTVNLNNLNDNIPSASDATISLDENSANGSAVHSVAASDADGDALTFEITDGNSSGAFTIDATTGAITVADATKLNYEAVTGFTLTVKVSDLTKNDEATITVTINDIDENVLSANDETVSLNENSINGASVITVSASDPENDPLTFSITSGNDSNTFKINSTTGSITVLDSTLLDFETITQFFLKVSVTDNTNTVDADITINLIDINDVAPIANGATVSLDENSPGGTSVHTVSASDIEGNTLIYSVFSGNTSGAFTIDSSSGEISVADSTKLNFESTNGFTLIIKVSDGVNFAQATIIINLNNLNDNTPTANAATVNLEENKPNGSLVHTVSASDIDGNTLNYLIKSGNTGTAFSIDSNTGDITVFDSTKVNFEAIQQFNLVVTVSDGLNSIDISITIDIENLNDNKPEGTDATLSLNENSANGTSVYTVAAFDADGETLEFSITNGNTGMAFEIGELTGEIIVKNELELDYETNPAFTLTVKVSDGINHDEATISINLNNLNDSNPVAVNATVTINENSENGSLVHTVSASDSDGNVLSYSITAGNTTGAFTIDSSTGAITVADSTHLDYELNPSFTLTIEVSDGSRTGTATIKINLTNLNDTNPIAADASVDLNENVPNSTAVHTVIASDADGSTLTYTITGGNSNGAFSIDASTGAIIVADSSKLDYETTTNFTLTVEVSDGSNSVDATITINIKDVNDNLLSANNATISLDENSSNGTSVHTIIASDPENDPLTYSISSGNSSGAFAIDASTGAITVANYTKLDFETLTQFILKVSVTDNTNTVDAIITINLNDINEPPTTVNTTVNIDENSPNSTIVHIVSAADPEGHPLSYSITSGNLTGAFAINTTTGEISVADVTKLDYEIDSQYSLIIQVSDGINFSNSAITVNLNNVNDNSPIGTGATITLDENTGNGILVYTPVFSDADGNPLTYSITSGNNSGAFSINPLTGVISVADATKLDYEINVQFIITIQVSDGANIIAASITINLNDLDELDISATTISASPASIVANGISTSTIIIQLKDVSGNNLSSGGSLVTVATTGGAISTVTDHGNGSYTAILTSSTLTGTAEVSTTVDGATLTQRTSVAFIPGEANIATTEITASLGSINADGKSTSTITIRLKDQFGNSLTSGQNNLLLTTSLGTLSALIDNGDGTYSAILTSSESDGTAIISGFIGGAIIADQASVEFLNEGKLILNALIESNRDSLPADGQSTANITVTLKDIKGNNVSGHSLILITSSGTISEVIDNGNGTYSAILTSSTIVGSAEISGTLNDTLLGKSIIIKFTELPSATAGFFIPEGFSPDGDGVNDRFIIEGAEKTKVSLAIYNRWGNMVYESKDYKNDWEGVAGKGITLGEKLPDGTYYYLVDFNNGKKPVVRYFTIKRK